MCRRDRPHSRHIEHRFCGADVNLYVAAATVLAGCAHGIEQQLDPGPPAAGNAYANPADPQASAEETVPLTWEEAIRRAQRSPFLRQALGPDFHRIYLAIKAQECSTWGAEVTATDLAWYLRNV